jgi:predicted DsbA family dithiol-disulfide isomerase
MIYLCIFTTIGFIAIMGWCFVLRDRIENLTDAFYDHQTTEISLSKILLEWDTLYVESNKHQRRQMTIDRQKYGIKTAAKMHGVIE